jgi:hypothetical protein
MMGDVYAKVAAVYVWLGPHDYVSRTALPVMEDYTTPPSQCLRTSVLETVTSSII